MEETSKELPNFSIDVDFLGPDPTSRKNKAGKKKNTQCARFAKLSEDQLQQILGERHSLGTKKSDVLSRSFNTGNISLSPLLQP